jgi:hypothetical protein
MGLSKAKAQGTRHLLGRWVGKGKHTAMRNGQQPSKDFSPTGRENQLLDASCMVRLIDMLFKDLNQTGHILTRDKSSMMGLPSLVQFCSIPA